MAIQADNATSQVFGILAVVTSTVACRIVKITGQDLRSTIVAQWLPEDIAMGVSDDVLGPPSETPYGDLKAAILRRPKVAKAERLTLLLLRTGGRPLRHCIKRRLHP